MELKDTPAIRALPHPVRTDAAFGEAMETLMFERLGVMPQLRPYLADAQTSTEWIINNVPGVYDVGKAHFGLLGGRNMGTFMLTLVRARLRAQGDPIVQLTPVLQAMLGETDLAAELPAGYFRSPYPLAYIEFARPNALQVSNHMSGLHECEGAYLGTYELPAGHEVFHFEARNRALRLDPDKPVRAVETITTGSPVGKTGPLDDASHDFLLLIQDEDESLQTVLDRHIDWYNEAAAYSSPGMAPLDAREVALINPVIDLLAKALLYLNLNEAEKRELTERSDLERKLKRLGYRKANRMQKRLAGTYDRIVIGPANLPDDEEQSGTASAAGEGQRSVKAHWRRGHFRTIRYGEQRAKTRLGWIKPVLVNAGQAFEQVKTKPYVVR